MFEGRENAAFELIIISIATSALEAHKLKFY